MNFTRKFFQNIADTMAILYSLWFFVILMFVGILFIYMFTGYLMNPFLPLGLFFIYALFCESERYKGIGWLVAIVFTIVMLTAGSIPTTEEQEAMKREKENEEYAKKQEKLKYAAKLYSFKDSDGNEIIREKSELDESEEPQKRYRLKNGQKFLVTFQLFLKDSEEEDEYPLKKELKLNRFRVNADEVYFYFYPLKEVTYDETTGELTGVVELKFSDNVTVIEDEFRLQLVSEENNLIGIKSYRTYYNIEYEDAYPEEEKIIESSEVKQEVTNPSVTSKVEPEDVIITEGNVEDWDHILDDWELEEAREQDEFYE
ncbi:hypothetical protein CBF34_11085 [Vagococcus penaei]|uniref:Uncharacterized protein n=1 Tax=Vagococcus penaei TaxID=633807 RepID=A0A1Q2D5F6_9ENTE|nr:hypothetical protein [Vagococcus penaei]AQP53642.1 hypothetical protein BW732_04925 [Vagococcus penaei]RST97341.1 hypothetical protein CBF34_11085 [Vagococcus penaei]